MELEKSKRKRKHVTSKRELGSEDTQRPGGQVVQEIKSSQSNQPIQIQIVIERNNPLLEPIERSNPLLKRVEPKHVHLMTARVSTLKWHMIEWDNLLLKQEQEMCQMVPKHVFFMKAQASTLETKLLLMEIVVNRDESSHEQTMLNEVNIDFRIPGLPHSVVKHAQRWTYRLLHTRASPDGNSDQSRFHWTHIGPAFNSRTHNQEGKTSWPLIWETTRRQRRSTRP